MSQSVNVFACGRLNNKTKLFGLLVCWFISTSLFAQFEVKGGNGLPLLAENSGTEVYLLNGLTGAEISFTANNDGAHQWYKYDENASQAIPIPCTQSGKTSTITDITDGYGYYVAPPSMAPRYIWTIDYSLYISEFYNITIVEEEDKCEYLKIITEEMGETLRYYTPSGVAMTLQRSYHLQYNTLEWDGENQMFVEEQKDIQLRALGEIVVEAPLMNTDFTLIGDDFATHFGISGVITSPVYEAIAVEAHGVAESRDQNGETEQYTSGDAIGGSAPLEITFTAYANEPVAVFYIWKIAKIDETTGEQNAIVRYTEKELQYNFSESGQFLVSLEVMDRQTACVDTTQFFNVTIGETEIEVPNFFSPGSTIGSNDEFKVSYKSIISFKCSIFNRWGNLLYRWTDPAKGWDGRVNGKFVPTGVYYYMIEYKGADGKTRTKSGDINILRSKNQ